MWIDTGRLRSSSSSGAEICRTLAEIDEEAGEAGEHKADDERRHPDGGGNEAHRARQEIPPADDRDEGDDDTFEPVRREIRPSAQPEQQRVDEEHVARPHDRGEPATDRRVPREQQGLGREDDAEAQPTVRPHDEIFFPPLAGEVQGGVSVASPPSRLADQLPPESPKARCQKVIALAITLC